jgi:5'-methylthioadenosine phosphorylase
MSDRRAGRRIRAVKLGIITGSGTHSLPGLEGAHGRTVATRFGPTLLREGRLAGVDVVHVSRHGAGHRRLSSHVNHRANVLALRDAGVSAVFAATVCGAVDPHLQLGSLVVFDDLHFLANRLPDGSLCSLYTDPGAEGRGHWVFDRPFSQPLREALLAGAHETGHHAREDGCYGHVDGPRFNSRSEIRMLASCGVAAVSQTGGPETVLCGEAELPYALIGYVTDHANGVREQPTPLAELARLMAASTDTLAETLAAAAERVADEPPPTTGTHLRF